MDNYYETYFRQISHEKIQLDKNNKDLLQQKQILIVTLFSIRTLLTTIFTMSIPCRKGVGNPHIIRTHTCQTSLKHIPLARCIYLQIMKDLFS